MHPNVENLHIGRIDRFHERLGRLVLGATHNLTVEAALVDTETPFDQRLKRDYKPLAIGDTWGRNYQMAWIQVTGTVPDAWAGETVALQLDVDGEGLLYTRDGKPITAISAGSIFDKDYTRDLHVWYPTAKGGEEVEVWIDASANDLFGLKTEPDPTADAANRHGEWEARLKTARLAVFRRDVWDLWCDLRITRGLIKQLPETSVRRARLIRAGSAAVDAFRDDPAHATDARAALAPELNKPAAPSDLTAVAVGHAHIDTAWLWPVREGLRKIDRTFSSQLDLLDRHDDYVFGASQPAHYKAFKQRHPKQFERIRAYVEEGRWEPQGGMWVEADCNLISGEAMIRQLLHGTRFFRDEFGVDVDNLWLPDVFGYSAAMPQILRRAGIPYFLTQKLSWSQFNTFPHHTFIWRGIDGSEVIAHFPPEGNYNSMLDADYLIPGRDAFKEKDRLDSFLSLYGVGDGGGGPKDEVLDYGRRLADCEGAPKVQFGTAAGFFHDLADKRDLLDTWSGELYLEFHRGTLTTQAAVKRGNRQLEYRLQALEMLYSLLPADRWPGPDLREMWETLLLHQFHDILPGSSVRQTYVDTLAAYDDIRSRCTRLEEQAARALGNGSQTEPLLFNPLSQPWSGAVPLNSDGMNDRTLGLPPGNSQRIGGDLWARVDLPPLSVTPLRDAVAGHSFNAATSVAQATEDGSVLQNDLVRYRFDGGGRLCEATDLATGWDFMPADDPGNRFTLYQDRPNNWDAWDIDLFYETAELETARLDKMEVGANGPVARVLRLRYRIGQSTIDQVALLFDDTRELRFLTRVDWREDHKLLRVAFPTTVVADSATHDIQYGYVQRPTHRNTLWDVAKFETAHHRYMDLSDQQRGIALLNDGKYGGAVHDGVLSLSLLRAPTYPDPDADRGVHTFSYSLLPHDGTLPQSDVIDHATRLNQPPVLLEGPLGAHSDLPFQVEGEGVAITSVKRAFDGNGWIVRLVETRGMHSTATLSCSLHDAKLVETNLLERPLGDSSGTVIQVNVQPFEIRTFGVFDDPA